MLWVPAHRTWEAWRKLKYMKESGGIFRSEILCCKEITYQFPLYFTFNLLTSLCRDLSNWYLFIWLRNSVLLWNSKVHHHVHKSPIMDLVLNYLNQVHTLLPSISVLSFRVH
jgi:hypothetical protein